MDTFPLPTGGGGGITTPSDNPVTRESSNPSTGTTTVTMTSTTDTTTTSAMAVTTVASAPPQVLPYTLRNRPQGVTWNEDVEDNEGLGRKSSKRCCIFHKQREFGESSTDSDSSDGGPSERKIAWKKKVPDSQRHHA